MNDRTKKRHGTEVKLPLPNLLVATTIVINVLLASSAVVVDGTQEKNMLNSTQLDTITIQAMAMETTPTVEVVGRGAINTRPQYKLSLSEYYQDYTYDLTSKCGDVQYETAIAVLYSESKFDANAKNVNRNGSIDRGIAQINSDYTESYAELSGYGDSFDPYNAEHGIRACVYKLQMLADVWKKEGITDKATLELYTLESYHRGVISYKKYMAQHGSHSSYSDLILQRKNELLTKGEIITQ